MIEPAVKSLEPAPRRKRQTLEFYSSVNLVEEIDAVVAEGYFTRRAIEAAIREDMQEVADARWLGLVRGNMAERASRSPR